MLGNDTVLHEPPGIEGYLYRYRKTTHMRDPTYLATHNSNIFFINPNIAHPPQPPTIALQEESESEQHPNTVEPDPTGSGTTHNRRRLLPGSTITRASEIQRGAAQILNAGFFLDMRNILSVNRLKEAPVPAKSPAASKPRMQRAASSDASRARRDSTTSHGSGTTGENHENAGTTAGHSGIRAPPTPIEEDEGEVLGDTVGDLVLDEEDLADEGGDEVLDKLTGDARAHLKTKRSFEIVMKNHETIMFEVCSLLLVPTAALGLSKYLAGV